MRVDGEEASVDDGVVLVDVAVVVEVLAQKLEEAAGLGGGDVALHVSRLEEGLELLIVEGPVAVVVGLDEHALERFYFVCTRKRRRR